MQREIKFRGLTRYNHWVYGNLDIDSFGNVMIRTYEKSKSGMAQSTNVCDVIPETVGQFTGLKDREEKEIYEGDIVKCYYFKLGCDANLGVCEIDAEITGEIGFNGFDLCLQKIKGQKWEEYTGYGEGEGEAEIRYLHDMYENSKMCEYEIEVIGNIHDKKEK